MEVKKPMGNRVVVKKIEAEELKTTSGIIVQTKGTEKNFNVGIIKILPDESILETLDEPLKVGMKVAYTTEDFDTVLIDKNENLHLIQISGIWMELV